MSIKLGATFPTQDLGTDPGALREWGRGVEELGYHEIFIPEHVVGINADLRPDWRPLNPITMKADKPIYGHSNPFFEPFVAMGFLAAVTSRILLTSGIMIAPQRQTALLAKQAAIADILSVGRVRLGVGVGWNDAEFDALGANFKTRGRRLDEQVEALRRLWTEESVVLDGEFDSLNAVGLAPLPVQRPIPILIGGDSNAAMKRALRLGDGWFLTSPPDKCAEQVSEFWGKVDEAGIRESMSLIGTVQAGSRPADEVVVDIQKWADLGATHLNIRTVVPPPPGASGRAEPFDHPDVHLRRLSDVAAGWRQINSDS